MRYAKRTDANHAAIRDALRAAGYKVADLSACGGGIPDAIVAMPMPGWMQSIPAFLEFKDGEKVKSAQKLTKAQTVWREYADGVTYTVNSVQSALDALALHRSRHG